MLKSWMESMDLAGDGGSVVIAEEESGDKVSCREISRMGDNLGLVLVEKVFLRGPGLARGA